HRYPAARPRRGALRGRGRLLHAVVRDGRLVPAQRRRPAAQQLAAVHPDHLRAGGAGGRTHRGARDARPEPAPDAVPSFVQRAARDPLAAVDPKSDRLPVALSRDLLARGHERYDIYCSPCHDRVGTGGGMVVQRGYTAPPSFHVDRLRQAPVGHLVDVMMHGWGAMPPYAAQVPPADRWAIAAYIRALQRSQHARLDDLPPDERARLAAEPPPS